MPSVEEINGRASTAHQEARAALEKTVANYCPFGCKREGLDDHGYCHHLVGFTNDRVTFEPVANLYRSFDDGTPYDTGFKIVQGKGEVESSDVFVNPERVQVVNGIAHMAKAWVSDRVYRNRERPPQEPPPRNEPSELYRLQARKRELEKKLEERRLQQEIAALEEELGETPVAPPIASGELLRKDIARMENELESDPVTACDQCDFVAKTPQGLGTHKLMKHPQPDQGERE